MAISKILCIKESSSSSPGKHLQAAIDYITKPEKTSNGELIGAINCQKHSAYKQMKETKIKHDKYSRRQGYHLIISFNEGEVDENTAFKVIGDFAEKYLGEDYEAVYAVHNNTKHIHGHIIWNSVRFTDGKKYRYEKGDWEKIIQPLVNEICEKYGLSTLDIAEGKKNAKNEWDLRKDGPFVWSAMIRRDFDACIIQATDFDMFLDMLDAKGYEIKLGKYLAVKPKGMKKFRRSKNLGDDYTVDRICERILSENLVTYSKDIRISPRIVTKPCKRIKRAKLLGIQKRYFARLYRLGKIRRSSYSQFYKYKDDIKRMHLLQKEYLFLAKNNVKDFDDIDRAIEDTKMSVKAITDNKKKLYKERKSFEEIFKLVVEMESLEDREMLYREGDTFFESVHNKWIELESKIDGMGYGYEELKNLRNYYKKELSDAVKAEKKLKQDIHIAEGIKADIENAKSKEITKDETKDKIRIKSRGR